MSKRVLILSGSPRKGGNSDILCDEFMRGAQESGNNHSGECTRRDDMAGILQKMIDADVIILASPIYFYSISAQLKAVIDRTVARWLEVKNKEFYYIVTMADDAHTSADTAISCFRGYADCVEGAVEKDVIIGSGVYELGEVKNIPAMQHAYQMGKSV